MNRKRSLKSGLLRTLGLALIVGSAASAGWISTAAGAAGACSMSSPPGYLHSYGAWLESSQGCEIRLDGATWDGAQTVDFVPGGLDDQPYTSILDHFVSLGFNTVRIPLSDQLVKFNSSITITKGIKANPQFNGLHPLDVLDMIVTYAQQKGLMVILDNHFSMARACPPHLAARKCPANGMPVGLGGKDVRPWTDSGYTQQDWIADWVTLTNRYSAPHVCGTYVLASTTCGSTPVVIGFDLHNEPHTNYNHHAWTISDYLTRGAVWGPYPNPPAMPSSQYNPAADWVSGAEAAGDAILGVNPHLLIIVEGVELYPDKTQKHGIEVYTWGGILRGVAIDPVQFVVNGKPVLHQLVYSPHEWGPWKDDLLGEFSYRTTYASMIKIFKKNWAFLLHEPLPVRDVPIWLGEFNTCNAPQKHMPTYAPKIKTSQQCVYAKQKGSQGQWFNIMMQFLQKNPQVGWSYYPINGTNWLDESENNGILNPKWTAPQLPALIKALKPAESQPAA